MADHNHIVRGTMYLMPDNRCKDDLNNNERFIAITDAEILDSSGKTVLYNNNLLILNKDKIVWIFPQEEKEPEGGGQP